MSADLVNTEQQLASGAPVVFVHGLIGHLRGCAAALRAHGRETLAPDLLGYGTLADVSASEVTLPAQADELATCIRRAYGSTAVDIVGHSVGGAIAMLHASKKTVYVRRIVNVEGNFTLKDAFWSASLGRMSQAEVESVLDGFKVNPGAWLVRAGVSPTAENLSLAIDWLGFQPASTLRAMGRSIVGVTDVPKYLDLVRNVFARYPVYLLSGARSRGSWDVPSWALHDAAAESSLPDAGHMMMVEQPKPFLQTLREMLA